MPRTFRCRLFRSIGKYLFEFVLSQQAVVDENPGQPVAYGFRNQCCGDRRVHPSTDGTDCAPGSDLLPDPSDGAFDKRAHGPGTMAPADIENESPQQSRSVLCVRNFGMELNSEDLLGGILHCRHRRIALSRDPEVGRRFQYSVAMTHPHALESIKEAGLVNDLDVTRSVFALGSRNDLSPEILCQELHSVAHTEDRDTEIVDSRITGRRAFLIDGVRTARQNDSARIVLPDRIERRVERDDL